MKGIMTDLLSSEDLPLNSLNNDLIHSMKDSILEQKKNELNVGQIKFKKKDSQSLLRSSY